MGEATHDGLAVPGRVVLAHEPPFKIGKLRVFPAVLQLEFDGARETLEPRVMQVLVVLARAQGSIVTRDELLERCWDGRIVSDNAINRVISRLRYVGGRICGGCFAIETITKVGFRLATDESAIAGEMPGDMGTPPVSRRLAVTGLLAGGVAGAAGIAWFGLGKPHGPLPEARSFYERAIALRGQRSLAQNEQSVGYLREAVRLDPNYAEAWGALAWGYRAALEYGPRADAERIRRLSRSAAERALELDPENVDAQAAILLVKPYFGRWSEVELGCRKLLRRQPANEIPLFNLGWILNEAGRWRDSLPLFRDLASREPFWPLVHYSYTRALYCSDRLEEMDELLEVALRLWPRRSDFWQMRSRYLAATGRTHEAAAYILDDAQRPIEATPEMEVEKLLMPAVGKSMAIRSEAAEKLADLVRAEPSAVVNAVTGLVLIDQLDLAFSILEGYYFGRGDWAFVRPERRATLFLFFPYGAPLRADARFAPLVSEIGLEDYWRASGSKPDYRAFS